MSRFPCVFILFLGLASAAAAQLIPPDGTKLFDELCASCHRNAAYRETSADAVLRALESGPMAPVTASRTALERRAIAEFASGKQLKERFSLKPIAQATCGVDPGMSLNPGPSWNGYSPTAANARFQSVPGFTAAQAVRLKLRWAFAFPGEVNSDAAASVAGGRLFVGSRSGIVYSLDASSGCIYWMFAAESAVLHAVTVVRVLSRDLAIFADADANVYALFGATGQFAWKAKAGTSLAGAPVAVNDLVLFPTAQGLTALSAATGKRIWQSEPLKQPTAPAVDVARKSVYMSTLDGVTALDLETGKTLWSQSGFRAMAPAILANSRVLVADTSGVVRAFDPARRGVVVWQTKASPFGIEGGLSSDGTNVYAGSAGGGGLVAIRLADGKPLWTAPPGKCGSLPRCSPAQTQALASMRGAVVSGSFDGHVRAYQTATGKILWDFDTRANFESINGVEGRGGSLGGPGPLIVSGLLYVNSGDAHSDGTPGNVLLAFSVDGK